MVQGYLKCYLLAFVNILFLHQHEIDLVLLVHDIMHLDMIEYGNELLMLIMMQVYDMVSHFVQIIPLYYVFCSLYYII